jgi:hypothetical protein
MAKRKRTFSLDSMVAELTALDKRRKTLLSQLGSTLRALGASAIPRSTTRGTHRRLTTAVRKRKGRRKMSTAARRKISEAQKKRWAKAKAK